MKTQFGYFSNGFLIDNWNNNKQKMLIKILLVTLLGLLAHESVEGVNNRPILGALFQEQYDKSHQYLATSYVKFLEMAGARVVSRYTLTYN